MSTHPTPPEPKPHGARRGVGTMADPYLVNAQTLFDLWMGPTGVGMIQDEIRELVMVQVDEGEESPVLYACPKAEQRRHAEGVDATPPWILTARERLAADPFTFAQKHPAGEVFTVPGDDFGLLDAINLVLGEDIPAHAPLEIRDDGKIYAAPVALDSPTAFAEHFGIGPEDTVDHGPDGFAAIRADMTISREAEVALQLADRIDRALIEAAQHQRPAVLDAVTLIHARDALRAEAATQPRPTDPAHDPTSTALGEVAEAIADVVAEEEEEDTLVDQLAEHLATHAGRIPGSEAYWHGVARVAVAFLEVE